LETKRKRMNVIKAVRNYVDKMLDEVQGMKIMLLDNQTTGMISIVYSQTEVLQKEVFLVDKLEKEGREKLPHLKAVVFIKPSEKSIHYLIEELRTPRYKEYYIFFNNVTRDILIQKLAEADFKSLVNGVYEYFADYYAINNDLFSLNMDSCIGDHLNSWKPERVNQACEAMISLLLSLKKRPLIRYEKNSEMTKKLANEINFAIQQETKLFEFKQSDSPPLLLILDRRNDPVTPLLDQWTYQAMIHELIGIRNNMIQSENKDLKDTVLSSGQDPFYDNNMFLNFGDLGVNVKAYVDEYQQKMQSGKKIESINDMKKFVEEYPQFKKLAGNVAKHVALISELSKLVDNLALLEVSELEQELAVNNDHQTALRNLQMMLISPKISSENKVRLVLLYALRYEKNPSNELSKLIDILSSQQVPSQQIMWISSMIRYAGASQRQGDLFQNEDLLTKSKNILKKGLNGVENIYTQHSPLISRILTDISMAKLKDNLYPFIDAGQFNNPKNPHRPQDVIVFFVGGCTYEEARFIRQINDSKTMRVVLGGTTIHNSKSFLKEMEEAIKNVQ